MRFPRGGETWDRDRGQRWRASPAPQLPPAFGGSSTSASVTPGTTPQPPTSGPRPRAEDLVRSAGLSYAIVRPTLLYGPGDILINNMAWTLRRLPVFGIPGDGRYRVQPVLVDDVADLCIALAAGNENSEVDACGPENARVQRGRSPRPIRRWQPIEAHPPSACRSVLAATRFIGVAVHDVVLTRDEIRELMESLLVSDEPATTPTNFSSGSRRTRRPSAAATLQSSTETSAWATA